MAGDDFEIGEVESFSNGKDGNYSRSSSLMRQTNKVQDDLSREMKPSFLEIKRDRFGNTIKTLTDDARKRACESIKTLRNTMQCDFDDEIDKELKTIDDAVSKRKTSLLKNEEDNWKALSEVLRFQMKQRGLFQQNRFHRDQPFGEMFVEFTLEKHREIFQALLRLSKRMNFYVGESFEA